tara:strand:+ start:1021 stop:1464 length:444 start_codon:yes stop_codon:yes gene_type:complete
MARPKPRPYKPKFPKKYKGDPTKIVCRSSWETKYCIWLDHNSSVLEWASEEVVIPYKSPIDNKWHRYFTDFFVKVQTKDGGTEIWIVEIKPMKETRPPRVRKRRTKGYINEVKTWGVNEAKWIAAQKWCEERKYKFIILTEKELGIK